MFRRDGTWISEGRSKDGQRYSRRVACRIGATEKGTWTVENGRFCLVIESVANPLGGMLVDGREHVDRCGKVVSIDDRRFCSWRSHIFRRLP